MPLPKRMEGFQKGHYGAMAEGVVEDNWTETSTSLRIILVGRTGSGKSATGNSILCQPVFKSKLEAQPVTKKCQREAGTWNGRSILVVDTPSIFEAKTQTQDAYQDIGDCYLLSAPGPHVLLLVTQLGRFTDQDTMAVKRVKQVFGMQALRHTVVLFTHKEDLKDQSLEDYVTNTDNGALQDLVLQCGRRVCGFNNWASGEEQQAQLAELMAVIAQLEQELKGSFLSNDLFLQALVVRQGGEGVVQGDHRRRFLANVKQQVEKQKQELKEHESNCALKALLRLKRWVTSRCELWLTLLLWSFFFPTNFLDYISLCLVLGAVVTFSKFSPSESTVSRPLLILHHFCLPFTPKTASALFRFLL